MQIEATAVGGLRTNVGTGADLMVGHVIDGRYRLVRRLGAGGMGVVYEGCHEVTGRQVAVKLLHPSQGHSEELIERFAREARAGAAIGHPNIVDVLDAGNLEDGTPFLVMELLHGEPLVAALERDMRLSPERAVEIIRQAAAALDALHAHGVIHRDVKTDNLFIEHGGRVKLLDFGLAVFTEGPVSRRLTRDGVLNGTPHYMPPEVFDGTTPNPAWDVYALATVAFELLTGGLPFEGTNPMVTLYSKRESAAPRLGDAVDVRFSDAIERVIRRGLERDPLLRHATPGELADDLSRATLQSARSVPTPAGLPVMLAAPSSAGTSPTRAERGERLLERVGRRALPRAAMIAGAGVAVVCAAWIIALGTAPASAGFVIGEPRVTVVSAPVHVAPTRVSLALATVGPLRPGARAETDVPPATSAPVIAPSRAAEPRARSGARRPSARSRDAELAPPSSGPAPVSAAGDARELTRAGTSALMRGMIPDAVELLHRATLAAPRSSPAWRGLGLAYERMGRSTEARRAYVRYLELAPTAADADEVRRRVASL